MEASQLIEYQDHNNHGPVVAASPLDLPAEVFQAGLDRRRQNRSALMAWVRSSLVENVDFGAIQTRRGPSKPSLWKPGAEKICGMLGVTVHFPTLKDYEQAVLGGVSLQQIIIRCEIHDANGAKVADGVGARSLRQDNGDINKALKMAEKSAHIDATLRLAGLSEIFTQDLEDQANNSQQLKPQAITEDQLQQMHQRIAALGLNPDKVRAWLISSSNGRIEQFDQLTTTGLQKLNDKLDDWEERIAIMASH